MRSPAGRLDSDLLALLGGISGTYLTIGRAVRPHVDWGPYGAILCLDALWLLIFAVLSGASLAIVGPNAIWVLLAMALGPQLLGHIGFAWAVATSPRPSSARSFSSSRSVQQRWARWYSTSGPCSRRWAH